MKSLYIRSRVSKLHSFHNLQPFLGNPDFTVGKKNANVSKPTTQAVVCIAFEAQLKLAYNSG